MGLALSDKIVRQHAGRLDFCVSASGTTFFFELPIEVADQDCDVSDAHATEHESFEARSNP